MSVDEDEKDSHFQNLSFSAFLSYDIFTFDQSVAEDCPSFRIIQFRTTTIVFHIKHV